MKRGEIIILHEIKLPTVVSLFLLAILLFGQGLFSIQRAPLSEEPEIYFPSHILIGVIISENPSSSMAVLKDEKTGRIRMVKVGEKIFDLTVTRILENRIILQKGEMIFQVFMGKSSLIGSRAESHMDPDSLSTTQHVEKHITTLPQPGNIIKKEFARSEVERRILKEWQSIMGEVKFIPNYVNGEIRGFKITALPERSIISEAGIQKSDIIRDINGIELNDWTTLLSLYNKLKDENQFNVSIERKGDIIRILYILK